MSKKLWFLKFLTEYIFWNVVLIVWPIISDTIGALSTHRAINSLETISHRSAIGILFNSIIITLLSRLVQAILRMIK